MIDLSHAKVSVFSAFFFAQERKKPVDNLATTPRSGGPRRRDRLGQSRFGHPDLTNVGQSNFGQSISGSGVCHGGASRGGAPKAGAKFRKSGARRVGPLRVGPLKVVPRRVGGAQNFALFFPQTQVKNRRTTLTPTTTQHGLAKNGLAKIGLAKVGLNRPGRPQLRRACAPAAAHANKAFHLLNHEALTTFSKSCDSSRTSAAKLRNERASSDHPASDFASHHHQACPTVSLTKFGVGALFPNGLGPWQPRRLLRIAGVQNRPCAQGTPSCRSQAERHETEESITTTSSRRLSAGRQVQILDRSQSLFPRLSADVCSGALQGEPPSPQDLCVRTSCVVATWIEWTATPAT